MRKLDDNKALVLFSGGQDSAIALAWALKRYDHVETIGFDYGQRHNVELRARQTIRRRFDEEFASWAARLGEDTLVRTDALKALGETALTHEAEIHIADNGLPTTFVPGRNLLFLVLAGALAYRRNIGVLVGGMCEADYSGYPDCRQDALAAQTEALKFGMDAEIDLQTPLMHITKGESWRLAQSIGGDKLVGVINEESHTCYLGERGARHEWGYGCGTCPACELRAQGWAAFRSAV